MEPIQSAEPRVWGKSIREPGVRELLDKLVKKGEIEEKKKESTETQKDWKWPFKWKGKMRNASKKYDRVLVFYLNIKGELETPMVVTLYSGNMVIIRHKVYEVDPRAFWIVKIGMNKIYKLLIIKEIDRRPVSNLDWAEIRRRGDATDSDEFLIKAALKAQIKETAKQASKWIILIIVLAIVGGIIWFFTKGG